jgi:galactoside O-acetyltransferase
LQVKDDKIKIFESAYYTDQDLRQCGFKSIGRNVLIHQNVNIHGIENISIGNNVRIDPYVSIVATGKISLGSYIHIGSYCLLQGSENIIIKDFSTLSHGVKIYTRSDDYSGAYLTNPTVPDKFKSVKKGDVVIKRHVIIGSSCVILPGVVIGEGVSVGAMSLVKCGLTEWGIYVGIPAKKLKSRSKDLLKLEAILLNEN